ncbi:MAG: protein kinase [Isosphaeraceae bacterium]
MSQQDQGITEEISTSSDPDSVPVPDLTGVTLGDYRVKRLLGRGGMGQVYLATQVSLDRPVALKVLHPRFLSKPAYLSRFEAEATAVAKLNHPNIVHVYALGEGGDQLRFIAMEYVEGTNLREYIQRKGALDLPLAYSIMRQAAQGIGAAGEVGLVHRDIKPENLLLTRKGRVKVADFGLCRDLESDRFHVTQPGITMGTPLYMSPEQAQGRHLDHRSDLYSLGVTFYHMLVGEPPFRADSAVALALKHVSEPPLGLRVRRPEIPPELERLVLKLMAKDPNDRYQSAAEMLAELARIRSSVAPGGPTMVDERIIPLPQTQPLPEAGSSVGSRSGPSLPGAPSGAAGWTLKAGPWALTLVGSLCLLGGAVAGLVTRSARPAERPPQRMPLLGLDPRWEQIPAQAGAEGQYRYAQFQAAEDDQTAAWLAVAGRFPKSPEWVSRAYLQVARRLYRQRDAERLATLKSELAAWPGSKTGDQELVQIVDTAIKLCHKDYEGVLKGIALVTGLDVPLKAPGREQPRLYDPGKLEFCAEIVADALHAKGQSGSGVGTIERDRLSEIEKSLLLFLRRVERKDWIAR